jgi:hypothetical protein
MEHARGGSLWPLLVVAAVGALGFRVAFAVAAPHVEPLRVMREAPRATLAQPREGPAVYAGEVFGPQGRVDSAGDAAAAHWWWVIQRVNKNTSKTVCFKRDIAGMRLRSGSREVSLQMFDGSDSLSLLGRDRDSDWTDRLLIDLAGEPVSRPGAFPPHAESCRGSSRTFVARSLPQGASAEVLACHHDGALVACPGPLQAVLALDNLGRHRRRRLFAAETPFLWAAGVSFLALAALLARAYRFRTLTLGTLVPGERA